MEFKYTLNRDEMSYSVSPINKDEVLSEITIPPQHEGLPVTEICSFAFADCKDVERLIFPKGLQKIVKYAFRNCRNIKTLNFPKTLVFIGFKAFEGCNGVKTIIFRNPQTDFKLLPPSWNAAPPIFLPFEDCEKLEQVYVPYGSKEWYSKFIDSSLIIEKDILE